MNYCFINMIFIYNVVVNGCYFVDQMMKYNFVDQMMNYYFVYQIMNQIVNNFYLRLKMINYYFFSDYIIDIYLIICLNIDQNQNIYKVNNLNDNFNIY